MAIIFESARFLLACRRQGVSFADSLTLGRQEYFLTHAETRTVLREGGLDPQAFPRLFPPTYPAYAEPFWEALGAQRVEAMDASGYEGATVVHDLNTPLPESLRERFSVVLDAGTLEHVFHFPLALRNSLEAVRVGGHFLVLTGANNHFGHGFYQFSPDLYFRALTPENGFQVERMYAVEFGWRHRWFEVADPAAARARVTLINRYPVMLFVQAKRLASVPLFQRAPQQSDYVSKWTGAPSPAASARLRPQFGQSLKQALLRFAPRLCRSLEYVVHTRFDPTFSWRNRRSFRPVDPRRL